MSAQLDAAEETLAATAEVPSQGHRLAADEAAAAGEATRVPTGQSSIISITCRLTRSSFTQTKANMYAKCRASTKLLTTADQTSIGAMR